MAELVHEQIASLEEGPLRGRHVMVARARASASQIAARLRALGATVLERPKISLEDPEDLAPLEDALRAPDRYDAIVFGCSAGVRAAVKAFHRITFKPASKIEIPVIAVGPDATDALVRSRIFINLRFDGACQSEITKGASVFMGKHILLVTSTRLRPGLKTELEAAGASVEAVPSYRLSCEYPGELNELPDLIVLPSSSAARLLLEGPDGKSLLNVPMVAIGPLTDAAAQSRGATKVKRCHADNIDSVIEMVTKTIG